jgi:hypothetical protein
MTSERRHDLDAGGALHSVERRRSARVAVVVDEAAAHYPSTQHTAWMLLNELVRLEGLVEEIALQCPDDVSLAGRVVPLAARDTTLRRALREGCEQIGIVPLAGSQDLEWTFVVGQGVARAQQVRVYGCGWSGGYSSREIGAGRLGDANPIGPYIAASLAVGELVRSLALKDYTPVPSLFYSAWELAASVLEFNSGPPLPRLELDAIVAGTGAVGSMVVHTLWALPAAEGRVVLCDADKEGVDDTNLHRYPLFGQAHIGHPKASTASTLCSDSPISFVPVDRPIQAVETIPPRVVSAVDINTARDAIQLRYPARILAASTHDLRAEMLRVAARPGEACLRCHNTPEPQPSDDELRTRLQHGDYGTLEELARDHGLSVDEVEGWIVRNECGRASERLLSELRANGGPRRFAVSFVSCFAGALLAAELLKDMFAAEVPLGTAKNRAIFQFAAPTARTNRSSRYAADPACPRCGDGAQAEAVTLWRERASSLSPARGG